MTGGAARPMLSDRNEKASPLKANFVKLRRSMAVLIAKDARQLNPGSGRSLCAVARFVGGLHRFAVTRKARRHAGRLRVIQNLLLL